MRQEAWAGTRRAEWHLGPIAHRPDDFHQDFTHSDLRRGGIRILKLRFRNQLRERNTDVKAGLVSRLNIAAVFQPKVRLKHRRDADLLLQA